MIKSIILVFIGVTLQQKSEAFFTPHRCVVSIQANKEHNFLSIRGGSNQRINNSLPSISPATASLFAGSVAGAIGVGIAFPLDTLKTKSQVISKQIALDSNGSQYIVSRMNMLQLMSFIYAREGLEGFFGGVKGMMIGQAVIKAVAFATNSFALSYIRTNFDAITPTSALLLAACTAGFVTSFIVTPIERVKVMMQASRQYPNEISCVTAIINAEGIGGFLSRGLFTTLGREIPSYGIYFFIYGFLSQTPIAKTLGPIAPLVFGAMSGMGSWLPVYPIDVVKTLVQNTDGSNSSNSIDIAKQLYLERGIPAFFDGIFPKMLRAAVNHAVTFFCYDIIIAKLM